MATFRDTDGREWIVRFTLGTLPRLKAVGFDIAGMVKAGGFGAGPDDPDLLGKVMWVLVERQAEARGVTPEALAEAMDGESIYGFQMAFAEALTDFSQPPEIAAELRRTIPAEVARRTAETAAKIRTGFSGGAGNSPASSASTPATCPCENWRGRPTGGSPKRGGGRRT